ncbi:NAD(P)-dependent oxidoreductase [Azospirillum sp. TSA6c]|uniref:NAD-dependent epimerase/dehydratase family protein n=1 Tax=unclassified Azospirillum TaxID=2630922 RepID=UPI000D61C454|nr:NAD(P)-dependent oxidoreductase [Azospirillum sp. TSA6c]PWC53854.1 epimerase [Azospirillum sp. TSA6c]
MRILLTGASSFTGYWFARTLAAAGHHVVAPLRGTLEGYDGIRAERVHGLRDEVELVPDAAFGTERFLDLLGDGQWDLLCHHGANVTNYRSMDFDVAAALADNTRNLPAVLRRFAEHGGRSVVLTGSVFEQGEGTGTQPVRAFSPYGLSKGLTGQMFEYWAGVLGVGLGKFVIPNPFGPFEEPRFCAHLIRCWVAGKTASVLTPRYVRDNIHVDLLARSYAAFAADVAAGHGAARHNPSGYVETQGAFALRFAREIGSRLGIDTPVELAEQADFSEPMVRTNTELPDIGKLGWSESKSWDNLAQYYQIKTRAI